jgi:hypothetical protein
MKRCLVKRSVRAALAGATVAIGLVVAATTAYSSFADGGDANSLLWADFENNDINSGYTAIGHNECCTYSVQTAAFGRDSAISVQHELRQGDAPVAGGMRAESDALRVNSARFGEGDTRFYAFSVYLPSTWEYDGKAEDIVFQWHNTPNTAVEPCETTKTPSAFLAVHPNNGGEWRLRLNSDPNACTTADSIAKTHLGLGPIATGQWTDFVFEFDWASDATGRVDVWQRTGGNSEWTHSSKDGGNTYNDAHDSGYIKWGIYKPGWNNGAVTDVTKRAVFHDNIAIGTTCASVMPPGWNAPCGTGASALSLDLGHQEPAVPAGPAGTQVWARRRP